MPAQPQWLLRLPAIIDELEAVPAPVVDRAVVERVFRVRRRRAIQLLGDFGGYQSGRTFLVDRDSLLHRLRGLAGGDRFTYEKRRRERLSESLERVRQERQAVRIPVAVPQALGDDRTLPALPAGTRLEPGRLTVEFAGVEELLGKLYQLAQAAAGDFQGFEALAGGSHHK
jgi:hypothetical protein